MPSQFFGLNIAYTGLLASNAALNATSNNIANVQTAGYSRQTVIQQAASALQTFQTYGCAGAGVETLAIERIRDEFYDTKYWNNSTKLGQYSIQSYYMEQVETYFDDNGKNAGFKTVFNQLMISGLEELLKNPDSSTTKSQFIGYAGDLTEYFNGLAGNMEAMQKDVNQELKLKIDEINSIAGEIATLNKQINTIEQTGVTANELRDRRALLLDQLSGIVDVEVTESPIMDTNNNFNTGANRFVVKIAGGQTLVDTNEYNSLECVARESYEKVNQTDIDGLYDVYWENGQKFNLYNSAMGGSLQGLVQMRDGNNGEGFSGKVTGVGETADGRHDTVTVEVTKEFLQNLNKCNLSDQGGIITLGNQEFYYDSWEYSCTFDTDGNPTYSYTFTLSDGTKNPTRITNDRVGKQAGVGESLSYQGIPYYMKQMNEWARTFSQKFNDILHSGYAGDMEGSSLFVADMETGDEQYDFPDATRYDSYTKEAFLAKVEELKKQYMEADATLSEADAEAQARQTASSTFKVNVKVADDSYYRMTAENFSILSAMLNNPDLLATKRKEGDGVEQNDLLEDLKDMATNKDKMSFRGSNASEFLQCMLGDIALNASRANSFYECYSNIVSSVENQRLSISGVDEDEEAVNLVKYQNSYNLASKMIQTLTEMYDRLILQTGV